MNKAPQHTLLLHLIQSLKVTHISKPNNALHKTDTIIASNGAYLKYCKPVPTNEECPWARGKSNADKLWELSEAMVGERFNF
jgi:hypothetical protein